MSRKSEEEIQEIMEEYRDAPMVVGIKVCPGVYTDLLRPFQVLCKLKKLI